MIGIISFVGNEFLVWLGGGKQLRRTGDVGDVAAGQQQCMRAARVVDDRVDLGRPATARTADGLLLIPLFYGDLRAPADARCAFTAVLSIIVTVGGSLQPTRLAKILCRKPRLLQRL